MPMLERTVPVATDDNTLAAIEAIRAALSSAVDPEDSHDGDEEQGRVEAVGDGGAALAPACGPFGHGKIRLHGRA